MDLDKIAQAAGLPIATIARELFPEHRFPMHAVKYLSKGKKGLSAQQIEILEAATGLSVAEMNEISRLPNAPKADGWAFKPQVGKSVFTRNQYRIDYYPATNVAYVYKAGALLSDHILVAQTIPLRTFLEDMDSIIASIEAQNR